MRLFLAISLDADTQRALYEAAAHMRNEAPDLSWTPEHKLHLTLRFLGDQPDAAAARIPAALDDVAGRHRPFDMELRRPGAFPNFRRARVVWMGVEPSPRLELLHHDVELACDALGFGVEGRPFRPHVTLGRVRGRAEETTMRRLSRAARKVEFEDTARVASIDLMRSTLGSGGSTYDRMHAAMLGGG